MNDDKILYFYNISLLPCGYYTVTVNGNTSEILKLRTMNVSYQKPALFSIQ